MGLAPHPDWADTARRGTLALFFASWSLPIALQQTALGCLLACLASEVWRTRRLPRTPLDLPLALFGGALLVSTLLSLDPLQSFAGYRKLWLIGGGVAVFTLVRDRAEAEWLLSLTLGVAIAVAAYSIVQHFTGLDLAKTLVGKASNLHPLAHYDFDAYQGYRVKGLHPSSITYAHNLLFPLALATAAAGHGTRTRRLLHGLGLLLLIAALALSLTRGAWVAYAGVLLLAGLFGGRGARLGTLVGMVVCGLLFVTAVGGFQERVRTFFDLQAFGNVGRQQIWRANWDMVQERPLTGWGYGNYKQFRGPFYERYPQYPQADRYSHAHNSFLQVWVDTGLLGLAAFGWLVWTVLRRGWRAAAAQRDEPLRSLSWGVWLGLVGFLLGGLTQYNLGDAEVALVWWASVGLLLRIATFAAPRPATSQRSSHAG